MSNKKIAIQGELGAYSHIAAQSLYSKSEIKLAQPLKKHLNKHIKIQITR